jgi:hypothetical protein
MQSDSSQDAKSLAESGSSTTFEFEDALPNDDKLVYRAKGVLHETVDKYVWAVVHRAIAASLLAALLAGVAFGYNAIKPILLDAGVLHSLCPSSVAPSETCTAQVVALNSLLNLAALSANFMLLPTSLIIQVRSFVRAAKNQLQYAPRCVMCVCSASV